MSLNFSNIAYNNISSKNIINLSKFQENLNSLLNLFMTDYFFDRKSKFTYPLCNHFSRISVERECYKIYNSFILIEKLCEEENIFPNKSLIYETVENKKFSASDLAVLLSELYSVLYKLLESNFSKKIILKNKKIPSPPRFSETFFYNFDSETYFPIVKMKRQLNTFAKEHILGSYLFSSLATKDYVKSWSDLDSLLILRKETLLDSNKIIQLRMTLLDSLRYHSLIQPLLTHGYFILTEIDLNFYPETFFPLILFKHSLTLSDSNPSLNIQIRNSNLWGPLMSHIQFLDNIIDQNINSNQSISTRRFEIKLSTYFRFLHSILMLPLLYLQVKGKHCYKRDSFEQVREEVGYELFKPVDLVSKIRSSWISPLPSNKIIDYIILKYPNPFLAKETFSFIERFYSFKSSKKLLDIDFLVQVSNLLNVMVDNLFKSGYLIEKVDD